MFFGSKRKKITEQVIEAVRPKIGIIQSLYGIPEGFWRDPYVLGYISGCISAFIQMLGGGKLKQVDRG